MYPLSLCPCLGFLRECGCRLHMPTERGASTDRTKQAEETQRATSNTTAAGREPGTATGRGLGVHAISLGCTSRKGRTAQHSSGESPCPGQQKQGGEPRFRQRAKGGEHAFRDSRFAPRACLAVHRCLACPQRAACPIELCCPVRCTKLCPITTSAQGPAKSCPPPVFGGCQRRNRGIKASRGCRQPRSFAACQQAQSVHAGPRRPSLLTSTRRTLGPAALVSGLRVAAPALRVSFFPTAASPDTLQSARFSARSSPHGGAVAVARWHGAGARRAAARCARVQLGSNLAQTYLLFSTDGQTEERRKLQSSLCIEG